MADLSLRIGIEALDRATAPLRRIRESTGQLGTRAREASERVRGLETTSRELATFRRLKEEARANGQALGRLDDELAEARRKLTEVGRATGGSGRAFQRARQHVAHLERQHERLRAQMDSNRAAQDGLRESLRGAGVDTARMAAEQRRLQAELEQANRAAADQAERLERLRRRSEGLRRLRAGISGLGRDARAVVPALSAVSGRLSALAGMTGLGGLISGGMLSAGLGSMMTDFADSGREIDLWAGRLGMGRAALQGLIAVGGRFGVEQDAMIDGLKELSLRADEFAETGAGGGGDAFQRLGLSQDDLAAVKGDTAALFELIRSKMEGIQDVAARQRLADELFGGQGGEQMTEMLSAGTADLQRMRDEADRMGAILSDEDIAGARDLSDGLRRLTGILGGLSKTISARLAPVITPLLTQFGDWIIANRDLIASRIGGMVEHLSSALQSIDWGAITAGLTRFRDLVTGAVDRIGGWDNALIAVGATLNAGLIGSVASLGLSIGRLGIRAASGAAPALLGLARLALPAVVTGLGLLRTALLTNPITAIVGGIALAAGLIIVYWKPIAGWFQGIWSRITDAASAAWGWLKDTLGWDPLADITGLWSPIRETIGDVLDALPGIASAAWDAVKTALSWSPLGVIVTHWDPITDWFGSMWNRITGVFQKAVDWIMDKIQPAMDAVTWVGRKVGGLFGDDDDPAGNDTDDDAVPRDARGRPIRRRGLTRPVFTDGTGTPHIANDDADDPSTDKAAPLRVIDTAPAVQTAQTVAAAQTTTIHQSRDYTIHVNGVGLNEEQVADLIRRQIQDLEQRQETAMATGAGGALYDGVR